MSSLLCLVHRVQSSPSCSIQSPIQSVSNRYLSLGFSALIVWKNINLCNKVEMLNFTFIT